MSKETFSYCDFILYKQLKRWAERRHSKKSKSWVAKKYWHTLGQRNWVFSTIDKDDKIKYKLTSYGETQIKRHVKVKGNKSPFDGDLTYWTTRLGKHPEISTRVAKLLKKQKGKCNHCGLKFTNNDIMEVDHIIPRW